MAATTQDGPFFSLPPEIRNHIYRHVSNSTRGKYRSLNDMKIPALFFTCHQALDEGFGIFSDIGIPARLDISNDTSSYCIPMRSGTKALLQLAGPLFRLQQISFDQRYNWCGFEFDWDLCFIIEIDNSGHTELGPSPDSNAYWLWLASKMRVKHKLEKELDLRLENRSAKAFDFEDLEMIVAFCNGHAVEMKLLPGPSTRYRA